jgi:hypothetical protein
MAAASLVGYPQGPTGAAQRGQAVPVIPPLAAAARPTNSTSPGHAVKSYTSLAFFSYGGSPQIVSKISMSLVERDYSQHWGVKLMSRGSSKGEGDAGVLLINS